MIAAALRNLPNTKVPALPDMADFATFVTAAEPALGWPAGTFLSTYKENISMANTLPLEASPLWQPLCELVEVDNEWKGTATELLDELDNRADESVRRSREKDRGWPKNARSLSGILNRLAPNLRGVGVDIDSWQETTGDRKRMILIRTNSRFCVPCVPTVSPLGEEDAPGTQRDARNAKSWASSFLDETPSPNNPR